MIENIQSPKQQERQPLGRRVPADGPAEQRCPSGDERARKMSAAPARRSTPGCRTIRTRRSHASTPADSTRPCRMPPGQKPGNGIPYFVPGCELSKYRREHDGVAKQDRDQRLPPVHPRRDQPRRHHIGRNAVRHRDPKRGVVIGRPVALCDRHRREVFVVKG